jgi:hypothetical protein
VEQCSHGHQVLETTYSNALPECIVRMYSIIQISKLIE